MDKIIEISNVQNIYFVGIGGIGMSALARYFNKLGKNISGYDRVTTVLTKTLEEEGMKIQYDENVDTVPEEIDLVVYTPAIPKDQKILTHFQKNGYVVMKRSQALGLISKETRCIAIAGTHGKTSTSSLVAHVLTHSGKNPTAFVGGIMKNYDSNYIAGDSDIVIVEADEYDRSFLTLEPEISVLLSVDPDHLDIYGDHEVMLDGFREFLLKTREKGTIILNANVVESLGADCLDKLKEKSIYVLAYGHEMVDIAERTKVFAENSSGFFTGSHNMENAIAALLVGEQFGVSDEEFIAAISSFAGIKRRFEKVYEKGDVIYVDDYAHHPTEIHAAVSAIRKLAGDRKVTGIFQPHLYSRTRDFQDGFAEELSKLDNIILLDIYPARELPIPGVSSDIIFNKIVNPNKRKSSKETLIQDLIKKKDNVILTIGAGDIDTCVPMIRKLLEQEYGKE